MIAQAFALLVEDGQVVWETKLHELVPEYAENSSTEAKLKELKTDADLTDLLALHLEVTLRNQYWTPMYQRTLLDRKLTATVVADLDPLVSFRERMFYNNWAYGLAGEILENVNGRNGRSILEAYHLRQTGDGQHHFWCSKQCELRCLVYDDDRWDSVSGPTS